MNKSVCAFTAICALALAAIPASLSARVIYVRHDAAGLCDGSSWANAYTSPHPALAAALPGDQIWVAQGIYHPGAPGEIDASFVMPSSVALYGGFNGTESQLSERDWMSYPTVFSGDLGDDDVFGNPWWNGWNIGSANSKRIVSVTGAAAGTIIDGLIVSNASGTYTWGAGIFADGSQLEIRHCTFRRNSSYQAGGTCVGISGGSATVTDCTFAENWGRFVDGVGIWTGGSAGARVERCTFTDNHADAYISNGNGAGIAFSGSTPSSVSECEFRSNVAVVWPGVQYPSYGGAIHNFGAPLTVDRCKFVGNYASNGGGIFSWKNLAVSNCLFTNNSAEFGGALSTYAYQSYDLRVIGCTIVNNTAHEVGGVSFGGYTPFTQKVSGCIFWGNSDVGGIHSRAQVKEATYSCVQNMWVALPGQDPIDPEKFINCIDSDPQFVQSPTNLRLRHASPCIDSADKSEFDLALVLDLDNRPRFVDLPSAPNVGFGNGPLPDMGCYEAYTMLEAPISFHVVKGTTLAGGLAELIVSDDQRLRVRPDFSGSRIDPNVVVETVHPCSIADPSSLVFTAELNATAGPNAIKLQAFNNTTLAWEDVATGATTVSDTVYSGTVSGNTSRFIANGQTRVRCWIKAQSTNGSRSWEVRIDQVAVEIRP